MIAVLQVERCKMARNKKLQELTPKERRARATRKWLKVMDLMTSKAEELGLDPKRITEITGRSASWVSKFNGGKSKHFESLDEFASALGYELSTFVAAAEDYMAIEDKHGLAIVSADDATKEEE